MIFDAIYWTRGEAVQEYARRKEIPVSRVSCSTRKFRVTGPLAARDYTLHPLSENGLKVYICHGSKR